MRESWKMKKSHETAHRQEPTASRQQDEPIQNRSQRVAKKTSQPEVEHGEATKKKAS